MYNCYCTNPYSMREASHVEWCVANDKFPTSNARGLAQWRCQECVEMKMSRSTNYTACIVPLMRRCCMAGHTDPAGISSFHVVVTVDFTAQ